jgi:hypothetical protein
MQYHIPNEERFIIRLHKLATETWFLKMQVALGNEGNLLVELYRGSLYRGNREAIQD